MLKKLAATGALTLALAGPMALAAAPAHAGGGGGPINVTDGSGSVLGGNIVNVGPVIVPINVCGNNIASGIGIAGTGVAGASCGGHH